MMLRFDVSFSHNLVDTIVRNKNTIIEFDHLRLAVLVFTYSPPQAPLLDQETAFLLVRSEEQVVHFHQPGQKA